MSEQITIQLPTPQHSSSYRGFNHLDDDFEAWDSSNVEAPSIWLNGEEMSVYEVEEYALALLWLVRNHYQGEGLQCEVLPVPTGEVAS